MRLSQQAIKEFKEIWKKEYKEKLTDSKVNEKGLKLLHLFKVIYRDISEAKK